MTSRAGLYYSSVMEVDSLKQDLFYIAAALKALDPDVRQFLGNSYAPRITAPKIVDALPDQWRGDVLYIVKSSHLPAEKPSILPANLLCLRDGLVPAWLQKECGSNVVITAADVTEELLIQILSDMRGVQRSFSSASDRIMEALYYGRGLQAIADIGADLLGNTVAILDANWKILATSYARAAINPHMAEATKSGYMDNSVIELMKADGCFEKLRRNGQLAIFPPVSEDPDSHGICWCYVRVNGTVSAYLVVYADQQPFTDYHPDLITRLSRFVSMELQKQREHTSSQTSAYEALMIDLLEQRITDQLVILRRLRLLDQKIDPRLHVITIKKMSVTHQVPLSPIERNQIHDFFPGSLAVVYEGNLVLLVSSEDGSIPVQEDMDTLNQNFRISNLTAGVSNEFTDISELSRYYRQSVKAQEFGWNIASKGGLFHYSEYAMYHALELCTKHVDLRDLCHPGILKLQESADPGDRDLFQTLYLYLLYMKDVNRVSQALNIHRSTLFYRLNKIKTIIGSDLDDGNLISHLLFSFKLIEYMDIFAPSESPLPPQ